jgi:hypothetical protein
MEEVAEIQNKIYEAHQCLLNFFRLPTQFSTISNALKDMDDEEMIEIYIIQNCVAMNKY